MLTHSLSILAYIVVSFVIQASSHLFINKAHYDAVTFMRPEPFFTSGVVAMMVQGIILTTLYAQLGPRFPGIWGGLMFSLIMGAFLNSYIALAEPSKYLVPSFWGWVRLEFSVSAVQFTLFGLLLGFVHHKWQL